MFTVFQERPFPEPPPLSFSSLLRPAFQALDPMTQGGRFEIETQIFPDAVVRDVLDMPVDPPQRDSQILRKLVGLQKPSVQNRVLPHEYGSGGLVLFTDLLANQVRHIAFRNHP